MLLGHQSRLDGNSSASDSEADLGIELNATRSNLTPDSRKCSRGPVRCSMLLAIGMAVGGCIAFVMFVRCSQQCTGTVPLEQLHKPHLQHVVDTVMTTPDAVVAAVTGEFVRASRLALLSLYHTTSSVLPWYHTAFVHSCGSQAATLDCIIVLIHDSSSVEFACATPLTSHLPSNVIVVHMTLEQFDQELMVERLHGVSGVVRGYKLYDLKPMYGDALEAHIPEHRYSHWAWTDMDMVIGDLSSLLVSSGDIIAPYWDGGWQPPALPGQLLIFKNTRQLRTLWRRCPEAYAVLRSAEASNFDEKTFANMVFAEAASLSLQVVTMQNAAFCDWFTFEPMVTRGPFFWSAAAHTMMLPGSDGIVRMGFYFHIMGMKQMPAAYRPTCADLQEAFTTVKDLHFLYCPLDIAPPTPQTQHPFSWNLTAQPQQC